MAKKMDMLGYCGIYCGDCPSCTQEVADTARELRRLLRKQKIDKAAGMLSKMPQFKAFRHFDKGYELLGAMMKIRCKNKCCRLGGWGGKCPIKTCAKKKGYKGCWQCDDFGDCEKLKLLEYDGMAPHLKNIRKIRKSGVQAFLKSKP